MGSTGGRIAGKRITVEGLQPPAPERRAPAIRPHRPVPLGPAAFDEFLNPLRFEQSRFKEQVADRAAHLHSDDERRTLERGKHESKANDDWSL